MLLGSLFLVACQPQVNLNHFVVPAGYTGPIAVISDPSFDSTPQFLGGQYVHVVPPNAVVCINTERPFRPYRLSAAYSDGEVIYSNFVGLPTPPNDAEVRIEAMIAWSGGKEDSSIQWFGVGDALTVERLRSTGIEAFMPQGVRINRGNNDGFKHLRQYCAV
jgi:hypothetical protein